MAATDLGSIGFLSRYIFDSPRGGGAGSLATINNSYRGENGHCIVLAMKRK